MSENPENLTTFYKGWETYQDLLIKAIAPLSAEQLTLRAAPHLRSIGEILTQNPPQAAADSSQAVRRVSRWL